MVSKLRLSRPIRKSRSARSVALLPTALPSAIIASLLRPIPLIISAFRLSDIVSKSGALVSPVAA